ncbi:flagellar hook-basal body protein [Patulibacter defluvii]|uniref:flagellar hook-basal body protein n=1 Tax=Patulibacter defluvii TaxID=3095358 RepID=UPI002A747CCD|nr:flagellar hook-basal body protein [Patulibacter sp. DM4]
MLQGLYSAAAGMTAQQTRMDAVSGDVANANTPGYRRERVAFRDLLPVRDGVPGVEVSSGAAVRGIGRSSLAGALRETGRALDVAITGSGFLQVERPGGGTALVRSGALAVDGRGRLTTATGELLAGVRPVPAGASAERLRIDPDGTVSTDDGRRLGRLRLVDVAAPGQLQPIGDGLAVATAGSGPLRSATGARLVQGSLETSNVDLGDAMVDLIESQRAFSMASRAVQMQDQMLEIANGVKR